MKVSELRSMLEERGLDQGGKKADLVERLKESLASESLLDNKQDNSKESHSNGNEGAEDEEEFEDEGDEASDDQESSTSIKRDAEEESLNDRAINNLASQEFVTKKPEGISFGLHTPKIKRPEIKPPPTQPDEQAEEVVLHSQIRSYEQH